MKPSGPVPSFGKETKYRGIIFRSECEARWAAVFDLLEYEWEYEPNGEKTFPDFMVCLPGGGTIYFEVKGGVNPSYYDTHMSKHVEIGDLEKSSHSDVVYFLSSIAKNKYKKESVRLACYDGTFFSFDGERWNCMKFTVHNAWDRACAMVKNSAGKGRRSGIE